MPRRGGADRSGAELMLCCGNRDAARLSQRSCAVGKGSEKCAPERLGANNFLPAAAPPLTAAVHVPQAGHAQFWRAAPLWQSIYDAGCGVGTEPDATIRTWTARLLAGWLLHNLPPQIHKVRPCTPMRVARRSVAL